MLIIVSIILLVAIFMGIRLYNNYRYINKLKSNITNNTNIYNIEYINIYNNYYIVLDSNNLYLITNKYNILLTIDRVLLHSNTNNYDIIYRNDKFMYVNDLSKMNKLRYRYYDIYTYKLIDEVVVG